MSAWADYTWPGGTMKQKVLVTCPVYRRELALPRWLDALADQKDVEVALALCVTPNSDRTGEIVEQEATQARFRKAVVVPYLGNIPESDKRDWSQEDRVRVIAEKRNALLDYASHEEFDYLLMLDSDVFPPQDSLLRLIETLQFDSYDAVCPKVWIWEAFYVAAKYVQGRLKFLPRRETGIVPVDVVSSGACMMTKRLAQDRQIRYGVAVRGKDFGWAQDSEVNGWNYSECIWWSREAKKHTYRLGANCNLTFEHKMTVE